VRSNAKTVVTCNCTVLAAGNVLLERGVDWCSSVRSEPQGKRKGKQLGKLVSAFRRYFQKDLGSDCLRSIYNKKNFVSVRKKFLKLLAPGRSEGGLDRVTEEGTFYPCRWGRLGVEEHKRLCHQCCTMEVGPTWDGDMSNSHRMVSDFR
jgi:hypothetical protein